jgi:hypothetical protein
MPQQRRGPPASVAAACSHLPAMDPMEAATCTIGMPVVPGATAVGTAAALTTSAVTAATVATASARTADVLGLPGYPTCTGTLTDLLSPTRLVRQPPPRFSTTRPLVADTTWASPALSTDSTMSLAIAAIHAALAASQEHERTASRALEQERALAATLTAQMATAQRLAIGPPPVD